MAKVRPTGKSNKKVTSPIPEPVKSIRTVCYDKPGYPAITTDDFPDGWQEAIIELGAEGGSKGEALGLLRITHTTFESLYRRDAEFRAVEDTRQVLCAAWWEKIGREASGGRRKIDSTAWIFNMKNRFRWKDRNDVTSDDKGLTPVDTVTIEVIDKNDVDNDEVGD